MSDPNGSRGVSPWWSLVLLPIAAGVGWLAGHVETAPAPRPVEVRAVTAAAPNPEPEPERRVTRVEVPEPQRPVEVAETVSDWTSFSNALSESERTGKPILIDFNADWCPPCQRMKREVFETYSNYDAIRRKVIPVSIVDRKRENGSNPREIEELQDRFGVDAFPTLIVYSPKTARTKKTVGFGGGEYTTWWITEAAREVR